MGNLIKATIWQIEEPDKVYILWRDGSKYEGSFLNGKRHGIGTFTSSNGSIYVGEWFDDLMHGKGKLTRHDGTVLSGSWQNGKFLDNSPPLPQPTSENPIFPLKSHYPKKIKKMNLQIIEHLINRKRG